MPAQSVITSTTNDFDRCQHRTPSGRRCKMPVEAPGMRLCFTHTDELKKSDGFNLKNPLLAHSHGFQTAQGINNSLHNLYVLLANNYLSPRRAAVLAYINSLLLRTLPAIDSDRAAGIQDRILSPADPHPPVEPQSDVSPSASSANLPPADSTALAESDTPPASPWSSSLEPDLTKKPS